MRVYISGPMTGHADHNYPAFNAAAAAWREKYDPETITVFNPAEEFDGDTTLPYERYMRNDITLLLKANAIAMLPGWRNSKGARFELLVAQMLGLTVFNAVTMQKINAPKVTTSVAGEHPLQFPTGSMSCFVS